MLSRSALIAAAFGVAGGCSLDTLEAERCESSAQCRAGFGVGFVCADDGFCDQAEPNARCDETFPEGLLDDPVTAATRIIIGNLMDRSSTTHQAREKSARLAVKFANEEGGVNGQQLGIVFCTIEESSVFDQLARTDAAVASARHLVDVIGVPAIVGPAASGDTQAVFQELSNNGDDVLVISPSATSPALTALDPSGPSDASPGLLWRTAPPDQLQSRAIVNDMRLPGSGRGQAVSSVAVIFQAGAYGDGLALAFAQEFQSAGGTVQQLRYENDAGRDQAVTTAGAGAFEEVLFISSQFSEIVAFLDSAATLAVYDGRALFLTDAAANQDVLTMASSDRFDQVRGTRPAPLDELSDLVFANFLASYSGEYGEDVRPFSFTANAYDAAWLVTYGISWAIHQEPAVNGTAIAKGMRKISSGDSVDLVPASWNTVQSRFGAGQSIDVSGASGSLDYDAETEETSGSVQVWEISGDEIVGNYEFDP